MSDIILKTLKKELEKLSKKRDDLLKKSNSNPYKEIIEIRKEFRRLVTEHGINSQQSLEFATKNADKEKELMKEAEWLNKNTIKIIDDICKLNWEINQLSNEVYLQEMRLR